ncbi:hypothetical protein IWZ00DRAFT_486232 [Phyllosticta capitalensis]|uniref:CFEM domain-containing protein n=1 Tax=Phyllosticta capitalensis TaxID=121624 RepID=A0ABR1YZ54_9PEZI
MSSYLRRSGFRDFLSESIELVCVSIFVYTPAFNLKFSTVTLILEADPKQFNMRFSSIALFAVVGSAVAQVGGGPGDKGLSTSPDSDGCFESCFRKSGCPAGDETCFCNNQAAIDKSACCVSKECSPEAQKIIGIFAHLICQKGTGKIPQRQSDGCKKSGGSRMIKG